MKRRQFIALAYAGTAASVLPRLTWGGTPCPPPTLAVQGGESISTSCVVLPPGSAPAWFVNMPDASWATVAANGTIFQVLPSPVPHVSGHADSPDSITAAWSGGGVDQARGEYILAANGGHSDYPGNEAYALSLRDETPAWRRITDPTPNGNFGDTSDEGNGLYTDGRPRAMHSSFESYGDGRVWFPLLNSVTSNGGGTINRVAALNRDKLGAAATPAPWTSANLGPWEVYGQPFTQGTDLSQMIFGVSAFDSVGHKVWALGGNSANSTIYWSVDTTGSTVGTVRRYQANQSVGHWGGWACVATDLRILVAGDHLRSVITVLDLNNPGAGWQQVSNVVGTGYFNAGSGGAYIPANRSIAVGFPTKLGTSFRKLKIPTKVVSGSTVYDSAGQWQWNTISPASSITISNPGGNSSAYSKWNVVENMGNGQSAIVVLTDINAPTYVYKVPPAGL